MDTRLKPRKPTAGFWIQNWEKLLGIILGVAFIAVMLTIALRVPDPPPMLLRLFNVVLALAAAGIGSIIPGLIYVNLSNQVRAGGAMAFFVITLCVDPAGRVKKQMEASGQTSPDLLAKDSEEYARALKTQLHSFRIFEGRPNPPRSERKITSDFNQGSNQQVDWVLRLTKPNMSQDRSFDIVARWTGPDGVKEEVLHTHAENCWSEKGCSSEDENVGKAVNGGDAVIGKHNVAIKINGIPIVDAPFSINPQH